MKLNEYLEDRKLPAAAKALRITRQWLWMISTGKARPSLNVCNRIIEWSEGKVTLADLLPNRSDDNGPS